MTALIGSILGAAALIAAPLLAWWVSARRAATAAEHDRQHQAYVDLLVASFGVAQRASALLTAAQLRSGLGEGLAVAFRLRKPVDPLELHDWINAGLEPLVEAWSRTWVYGSPQGVMLSNRLLESCQEVMELLNLAGGTGVRQKTRQAVTGINVKDLAAERTKRMRAVAVARRDLAEYMRAEAGRPTAALFSSAAPTPELSSRRTSRVSGDSL